MGNVLEFYLKMKDMMSSGIAKVHTTARDSFKKIQSYVDQTIQRNRKLGESFDEIGRKASNSGGMMKGFFSGLRKLGIGGAISGALIIGAISGHIRSGIEKYTEFQATNKSFEVLTGDKKIGANLAADLQKLQKETILGPEVFKNAQTMLGFGIAAEKVLPTLKMLGDVSMGDAQRLGQLTLAFSQVSTAGKLTGQDLLQFVNAGFNPLAEIAKVTGKSMGDLRKEMEKGNITSQMVEKAFEAATGKGGKFNDMMNQMATTQKGQLAQMKGQMETDLINIGEKYAWVTTVTAGFKSGLISLLAPHKQLQDSIITEKTSINTLVGAINNVNTTNEVRLALLGKLKATYPDIFGAIDTETIKNGELLSMLQKVNGEYDRRIGLAVQQNKTESLKEQMEVNFRSLVWETENAEGKTGKYWERRLKEYRQRYEQSTEAYQSAMQGQQMGAVVDRIKGVMAFAGDNSKVNSMAGGDQRAFLALVNKWRGKGLSGGMSVKDLEEAERLMGGKVKATDIPGAGGAATAAATNAGKTASNITSGGPRVINIHGVKFMDKLELHTATLNQGADEIQKILEDMFLRTLNSGASVQS